MPEARRPSPSAVARRRAGQRRLGILIGGVLLILALVITGGGHSAAKKHAGTSTQLASNKHKGKTTTTAKTAVDPLTTTDAKQWVASRQGAVSAAVENLKTGKEWVLNPSARDQTASIIKADILETLMYQAAQAGDSLDSIETSVPQQMIEASSDTDASTLWQTINGATGLGAYNALAGLTQTTPNTQGYWGETLTSAADQIKILQQLAEPSKLLSTADQQYELGLMENIDPGQNWGVTGGVPSGVTVALKNGWVNLTSYTDWEINSIGWVKGDGRDYLIAVLTAHDPSQVYGEETINKLAADVFAALGPAGTKPLNITYGMTTATTSAGSDASDGASDGTT